jgi:hypothetical protein
VENPKKPSFRAQAHNINRFRRKNCHFKLLKKTAKEKGAIQARRGLRKGR